MHPKGTEQQNRSISCEYITLVSVVALLSKVNIKFAICILMSSLPSQDFVALYLPLVPEKLIKN